VPIFKHLHQYLQWLCIFHFLHLRFLEEVLLEALSFTKLHNAQKQGLKSGEHDGHIHQEGSTKLHDHGEEGLEYPEQRLRCAAAFRLMEQHKHVLNGT
jgi:hypothetical protein